MLQSLQIKNYALIEELAMNCERGLNIITGETGAGKSIIVDALGLILGARADADAVRHGAEKAIVEGVLTVAGDHRLKKLLEQHEIEFQDDLIIRREVSIKGQSRSFINDTPATTALLKQVGDLLVDLHGQHEHQSLLRPGTHIELLDDFGGLDGLVEEFGGAFHDAQHTIRELSDLKSRERQLMERRTLYEFQVAEIDALDPRAGEEEELENELRILENAEKLFSATERLHQSLYEGDQSVHDRLVLARNELEGLAAIDKALDDARKEAASATAIIDELAKFIQQYNSRIEFNPERLEEIRNRLGNLTLLKKKYGGSLDAVIALRAKIGVELDLANNFEMEIASLQKKLDGQRKRCGEIAQRLSAKRQEVARKVNKSVVQSLADLGIENAQFETRITQKPAQEKETALVKFGKEWLETTSRGIDVVEFYVSTNIGEEVKPLAKVASGGEISRIMLSLKMILAKSDRLPLLIFDEIDVGVSGRIAQAVGRSMKNLSRFHQLIAITHLPQIAGFADAHFVVEKKESRGRSMTHVRKLSEDERIVEVARLMSGAEVTETGLESARELMGMK